MNNIKNADDVRQWARMIVDAKGDKYTPLAKADMLAIAQFIVDVGEDTSKPDEVNKAYVPPTKTEQPPTSTSTTAVGTAEDKPKVEEAKPITSGQSSSADAKPTSTATMMRSYALHRAGATVQQAYDKFLKWAQGNQKEASVMDFSTGRKSTSAAFAYWLSEIISVEVPTTETIAISR